MRVLTLAILCMTIVAGAFAQPATSSTAASTAPASEKLNFGTEGLTFPPIIYVNSHIDRTAQLLGDAYRRRDPLVWKRAQHVADLGRVALPAAAPYLLEAIKDPSPAVRAEAARSAGLVGDPSLASAVNTLLADADASVRREAVRAAASLARAHSAASDAIERGLADKDTSVVAASLQSAWTSEHGDVVAAALAKLTPALQVDAADALGRLKASKRSAALLPLLKGDVAQRIAASRALGEIADPSSADPLANLLADAHPSVRREAIAALGRVAAAPAKESAAIRMLADEDPTVRQAAAIVLTPLPSTQALTSLAAQLDVDYAPLHESTRRALITPHDAAVKQATIQFFAAMLAHANPRRREDASFVLGHLRSDVAIDAHVALLAWTPASANKADWPLIAQAAESLGRIGHKSAIDPLMSLVKVAPEASATLPPEKQNAMWNAMANALAALGRLRHAPSVPESVRILQLNPDRCPAQLRSAAAFTIGVVSERLPDGVNFLGIYDNSYEGVEAKFEALKALGNLRHAASIERLKKISQTDPTPNLRWMAHWSYQRAAGTSMPYTPPTAPRAAPVSIIAQD